MSQRPRLAHTLIELSVTMSVGSALMILAVGLLHQTFALSSAAQSRADQHRTFERLARDFRQDVHAAASASSEQATTVDLVRDDGSTIRYRAEPQRIHREERDEGEITRREVYPFDRKLAIDFEILEQPDRVSVKIRVEPGAIGPEVTPPRTLTAALGRRLAHQRAEVQP